MVSTSFSSSAIADFVQEIIENGHYTLLCQSAASGKWEIQTRRTDDNRTCECQGLVMRWPGVERTGSKYRAQMLRQPTELLVLFSSGI